jgi:hypothetical protein
MSSLASIRSPRVVLAALLVLLSAPALAFAHGDAASHYLETGSLYSSIAAEPTKASEAAELQLLGLLDAARAKGYPLKVALIADETDVIDMPAMLRHPQQYADFVVAQLEGVGVPVDAPVLVVSPAGIGTAGPQPSGALAGLDVPAGASVEALATVAQAAVRQAAEASGHALPANVPPAAVPAVAPSDTGSGSGSGYDLSGLTPILVFAAIFGSALAFYEGRSRLARRRRGRVTPSGGAA